MHNAEPNPLRKIPGHMRRPAIALMGEFSAGKSTLTNLLIGAPALPVQVTATQLPPVWITYGDGPPTREDLDGGSHPTDLADIQSIPLDETMCLRVHQKAEILTCCDLIDMPGISDPNMSPEVWQRVLPQADAVIWCTHATQAWRQSEAAVWDMVAGDLRSRSLLLVTRFDKVTKAEDKKRLVRRIRKETDGLFAGVYPVSLTGALAAGDDRQVWENSGAEEFIQALIDLIHELGNTMGSRVEQSLEKPGEADGATGVSGRFRARAEERHNVIPISDSVAPKRVVPLRPVAADGPRRARPQDGSRPA